MSCHSHSTLGHFGIRKTLARISERFYWPGMTKDILEMVLLANVFIMILLVS